MSELKSLPAYPEWLKKAWEQRDLLRRGGVDHEAPRVVSELEDALIAAERDWRGGADAEHVRATLADASDRLLARLGPIRAIPGPQPVSLAQVMASKPSDDPLVVSLRALLTKRAATPGATEASDAAAIAGFYAAIKTLTDVDLAAAVVQVAAEIEAPKRSEIAFLAALLRTRQPRPLHVETLTLDRLVALPPTDWEPATVRLALRVALRGELASARPSGFATVRPLLDGAARTRYEGETLLRLPGYASPAEAVHLLRRGDRAFDEVLAGEDEVEQSRRLVNEALRLLPAYGPFVERSDRLDDAWRCRD